MWAEIKNLRPEAAIELAQEQLSGDMAAFAAGARASDPIIACWMGAELVAMLGFIPQGVLTGTAYVWMEWTPALVRHRYATVRWSHEIIREAQTRYPRIIGRCGYGAQSKRWLESLGAKFVGDDYMIGEW